MVIALGLVVVEGRDALHAVSFLELVSEILENRIGVKLGVALRQSNDKLPGLDALSVGAKPLELLLTFPCQVSPEVRASGLVGGVEVLLPVPVADIVDAPGHIG